MKYTSFLSEHSVEFCLVSTICRILEQEWVVTPLYFWSTREGSRLAQKCGGEERIKILAMFARRPKMSQIGDARIQVKVNAILWEKAFYLSELGIPTICGVPVVSSLLEFQLSSPCVWLRIIARPGNYSDTYAEVDIKSCTLSHSCSDDSLLAIAEKDILGLADESRPMILSDAIVKLKEMRKAHNPSSHSRFLWFSGTYKPVYFLLRKREPG